ncbi:MAG: hypothetical protein AAGJ87_09055, partial [Pseudomonadota bacterium]
MTTERKSGETSAARDLVFAAGALLRAALRAIGKLIATVWRVAGALDAALWNGVKLFAVAVFGGVGAATRAVLRGAAEFLRWLPTPAGRAYAAVSGVVLIVASLWIIDELRAVVDEPASADGQAARPPVDDE